jgi:DNA repair photolyase
MTNATQPTTKTGVAEWASHSVNLINGCRHECRYCYAAFNACDRYHRIPRSQWPQPVVRDHDVRKRRQKMEGRVMFPTTHDITPEELGPCLTVLGKLLAAGNEVLIVSKPHLACIQAICDQFADHRSQILFRFTIGADNDDLLRYWEPGAPDFADGRSATWNWQSCAKIDLTSLNLSTTGPTRRDGAVDDNQSILP